MLFSTPYMERRSYGLPQAVARGLKFADLLVGDLQRVIEYLALRFAVEQDVPGRTCRLEHLLRSGFAPHRLALAARLHIDSRLISS
ncbi:hypothetical protein [Streptomyces lavendulocolor]|uniref:hypothetical protein n=1 Tax=Streptomyces lavendulocolor TaxID=67316 RepID=UPI00338813BB